MDFETILETDQMRVSLHRRAPGGGRTLLSFTGIGHGFGGMDIQKPEFFRAGDNYDDVLYISDLERRWGNGIDFDLLVRTIEPFTKGRLVDTIGNSMGGFYALLIADYVQVHSALAFVPQFSVHPTIVPWEDRWKNYRNGIDDWTTPSLEGRFVKNTQYQVVVGNDPKDRKHLAMIPDWENISKWVLPRYAHNPAAGIKQTGKLNELVVSCLDQSITEDWFRAEIINAPPPDPARSKSSISRRVFQKAKKTAARLLGRTGIR